MLLETNGYLCVCRRHVAGVPAGAGAATDMSLKLGVIKGESIDAKHTGEIDVLAWSCCESDNTAASRKSQRRSRG